MTTYFGFAPTGSKIEVEGLHSGFGVLANVCGRRAILTLTTNRGIMPSGFSHKLRAEQFDPDDRSFLGALGLSAASAELQSLLDSIAWQLD